MRFQSVGQIKDISIARVMLVALRAHGFHPLDPVDGGLPGVPNLFEPQGVSIEVPEDEAEDAALLLADLMKDMNDTHP